MEVKKGYSYALSGGLFILFILFTVAVKNLDVQPIGPLDSMVGFASINGPVAEAVGQNAIWYRLTQLLGVVAILTALGFAAVGVYQLIKYRSLKEVDRSIIALGIFYIVVMIFYVLFEKIVINYRPILEDGELAASYPSSHTMLVLCVMLTGVMELRHLVKNKRIRLASSIGAGVVCMLMIVGRTLCGVHWITDIIGGFLLSLALVSLFYNIVGEWMS